MGSGRNAQFAFCYRMCTGHCDMLRIPRCRQFRVRHLSDLAIILMYDAMGVRRETGIQAQVLNDMMKIFEDMGPQRDFPS